MMGEKRFVQLGDTHIKDILTGEEWYAPCETSLLKLLNEQQATIEQLRTQLAICQQSKSDDGRFQVWEVPPIPKGKRISFTTNDDGGVDE